MLGWIFKKKGDAAAPASPVAAPRPQPVAPAPPPAVDWTAALAQARGNDDALLALVRDAAVPLQVKQAAVEALEGEAALKLAEREFRSHDRRVHQLAKRRLLAKLAQRQTREQAAALIQTARSLAGQADLPANRGVEIDRAWQALDAAAIEPAQRAEFEALTAQLAAQVRQRADSELQRKRWLHDAAQALRQLQVACAEVAAGTQDRTALAGAVSTAAGVVQALPPDAAATEGPLRGLQQALELAAMLDAHVAVLERLLAGPAALAEPPEQPEPAADLPAPADDPQQAWLALPPLPDAQLQALLRARHAGWQQAREQARQDRQSQRREQTRERQRVRHATQDAALAECLAQAEAALESGQLAEAQRLLGDIDDGLQAAEAPEALRARIAAAQAQLAQLRGWQHWSGGRARDDLVAQAEALAAATVAASAEKAEGEVEGDPKAALAVDPEVARLSIRQRAELIATLRERWKEIDRLGGAGGRALWQRFDAALKLADQPVAAHLAAQRAAREANLAARTQLLEVLEAVAVEPVDAHALASALDRFQTEWRKLGPLEHTVPRAARADLAQRMEAAVQRVEQPLQAARRQARTEREALVAQARALSGDDPSRDLVGEVRALQAEWQRHAKSLPLARGDEQALWGDFKAATDAAFAARQAVFSARDAEFEAHAGERMALIERLRVRPEDSAALQRRTLAEVDAAWQRCGPPPRARAAALEAEFRAARAALRQWLDDAAQRDWQAACDALDAKLALCQAREQATADAVDAAAWQALPALPAPLEEALRRRAGLVPAPAGQAPLAADELLLQIETAWDLPTPRAHEAARRERKLLAMKAALEGRRAGVPEAVPPDTALALLLGRADLDPGQADRLAAALAAWRRQGPRRPG